MAEGHGLGGLQVGEARHHGVRMGLRLLGERLLEIGEAAIQAIDGVPDPQPEIERHLIVARARRVQSPGSLADHVGEAFLDVHVDVFKRAREGEGAPFDLRADARQSVIDRRRVLGPK